MNRKKNKLQKSNEELDEKIREIYYKSKRRYGAPKIYKTLKKNGENVSLKRVQRRMTVLGIKSVVVKKYKPLRVEKNIKEKENILNQDFTTTSINQKWSTDITYIHTEKDGWTYLASLEDLYLFELREITSLLTGAAFDNGQANEIVLVFELSAITQSSDPFKV